MTWNKLKWIALISMLTDHLAKALFSQIFLMEHFGMGLKVSYSIVTGMEWIGRIAFPIFAYGIAQGCMYTKSPMKYLGRLLVFAFLSELPFNLALHGGALVFRFNNVFFTLFLGAACCYILRLFREAKHPWMSVFLILPTAVLAELFGTDYGFFGVLAIIVPYIFLPSKWKSLTGLAAVITLLYTVYLNYKFILVGMEWNTNWLPSLIFALCGVALLIPYNGKQGSAKGKWFFYLCYPLHLLLFYLLSCAL